jgi:fermentation-respiration switch protein FrsA (DUF1100 family)
MAGWKWFLIFLATGYCALVALMYVAQRGMMYFPERFRTPPAEAGFSEAEEVVLDSADGEKVIVWHVAPKADRALWLYFHGNGGALRYRVYRFRDLIAQGDGLVALSYRGYAGSTGSPTEPGLIADARATYDFAAARYGTDRIALWGESLGTGVAIAIAAERPVARIVLEAPFLSALDVAQGAYPFIPARWLMKDQFRSDLRIAKVKAPVLILHGDRDAVVPISSGQLLYKLIQSPKRFVRIPGGGHENLGSFGILEAVKKFVDEKFD